MQLHHQTTDVIRGTEGDILQLVLKGLLQGHTRRPPLSETRLHWADPPFFWDRETLVSLFWAELLTVVRGLQRSL